MKENNFRGCDRHLEKLTMMKRMYIRVSDGHGKQSWKPIGWYCEYCGEVKIDVSK